MIRCFGCKSLKTGKFSNFSCLTALEEKCFQKILKNEMNIRKDLYGLIFYLVIL